MNRRQRLTGRKQFAAVRSGGVVAHGDFVKVRAIATAEPAARGAVAVQGTRSAVLRNRARRRTRAALGPALVQFNGLDVVVSVTAAGAAGVHFQLLTDDITAALRAAAARAR